MANHQDVGDALLLLAGQYQSEGSVVSAMRCLEAIAQAPEPMYPLTESKARRQLASLLLAHSTNVLEAKVHLEKTVSPRAVPPVPALGRKTQAPAAALSADLELDLACLRD